MSNTASVRPSTIDPVTLEIINSGLSSIAEEMSELLVRSSHSTNIKERRDCSTAILSVKGDCLSQSEYIPMHLGSFLGIIAAIAARHDLSKLQDGDCFIANDPYSGGGSHLPDMVLAEPIFVAERHVGWVANLAHHTDFADRGHAHIYQEGLRIPPLRLYRAGVLQKDIESLILQNCQVPDERLSDLRAQAAANRLGKVRFEELCDRYGIDLLVDAGQALLDYTERLMRQGIQTLPDGDYSFSDKLDQLRMQGELTLTVDIKIKNDEIFLYFDGPDQTRSPINLPYDALRATVYYAIKTLVDPNLLPNAGLGRPIRVRAREGSVVNCISPAAVDGRLSVAQRVVELIYGALADVVSEKVTAASSSGAMVVISGKRQSNGKPWVYFETIGGGSGAGDDRDGLDGVQIHMTNTANSPIEALEAEYPLTMVACEFAQGSSGRGRFRGGKGIRRAYRVNEECRVLLGGSRVHSQPWGLKGGEPGASLQCEIDGKPFRSSETATLKPGQVVSITSPGGGGYGPVEK